MTRNPTRWFPSKGERDALRLAWTRLLVVAVYRPLTPAVRRLSARVDAHPDEDTK